MRIPTPAELEAALQSRGWRVHHEPGRLNIVLLRRTPGTVDAFDDMLVVLFTTEAGSRELWACRCTADPGKPSRERPKRTEGTAVWAVGQVVDGLQMGMHRNTYACLVPVSVIPVLRYTSLQDTTGAPSTSSTVQIHRANADRESTIVGAWSEGCAVVANPTDYDQLISLARMAERLGWPRFTVSCLEWPA